METSLRNTLRLTITACRRLLEEDFRLQMEGHYDIKTSQDLDGSKSPSHLDYAGQLDRQAIVAAIQHEIAQSAGFDSALERFIRESAFTMLNRLAALKLLEHPSRGLILESIARKDNSKGYKQFAMVSPEAMRSAAKERPDGGYRLYLEMLFDDLAHAVGVLFDRDLPQSIFFPSTTCLDAILNQLNQPELEAVWQDDETIGWIYQYFTPPELRDQVRKASSAPRNSYELAFRNQFYTPDYVVKFLTDNTLGRTWYEMRLGETQLTEQCKYLVHKSFEVFLKLRYYSPDHVHPGISAALKGDFSQLPEDPSQDDWSTLALMIDGYETAEKAGRNDDLADFIFKQTQGEFERTGHVPTRPIDLWLCLFGLQRRSGHAMFGLNENEEVFRKSIYAALREALIRGPNEPDIQAPEFIPYREPKDPREIRVLDPACGSGHFLLYAFDLLQTIYAESWGNQIKPEEFGYREKAEILHQTVRLKPSSTAISNYGERPVAIEDAYVVVTHISDWGDGVSADHPYLIGSATTFRVPFEYRVKLTEFDYQAELKRNLFSPEAGEEFVRSTGCFDFSENPVVSREKAYANFLRQVPRLILENNLHGIDIDLRATQIAALALWLRAQRAYNEMRIPPRNRPHIQRSNIVCAEPMPGEYDLLGEFLRDLKPAVLGRVVMKVWEKMKVAGEAGSLLKIEREIREEIHQAHEMLMHAPPPVQLTLFGPSQPPVQQIFRFDEVTDEAFWEEAEQRVLEELQRYAQQAGNGAGVTRKLFAHDATQGFAFANLLQEPFDVVLMNPPFGAPSLGSKEYIIANYPRTKNDLYAAFVERGLVLLHPGGFLGAITNRTGFFLKTFQQWREEILLKESRLSIMADLGSGVLDTALVETAAYVLVKANKTL